MTSGTDEAGYWPRIERAYHDVSIYDGEDAWLRGLARHPRPVGFLLAVHWLTAEIDNGGLIQFFDNPTGVVAPEAVAGLLEIGMPHAAAVVAATLARFPDPYPREAEARQAVRDLYRCSAVDEATARIYGHFNDENGGLVAAMNRYAVKRC